MFGNEPEMDKKQKREFASSIIGKEGQRGTNPGQVETDAEPDNDSGAPQHKIERMVLEAAHNGHLVTHHYQQPERSTDPGEATAPEPKRIPPTTHVFSNPEELHDHVGSMLKHIVPARDGVKGGREY